MTGWVIIIDESKIKTTEKEEMTPGVKTVHLSDYNYTYD